MNTLFTANRKCDMTSSILIKKETRLNRLVATLLLLSLLLPFNSSSLFSQEEVDAPKNFNVDLHLKNMHLWQGFVVTPGVMMATSMEYVTNDQKFVAGLWGGASFNGSYKEFSYYTTYHFTPNLYAQLISHNNYSGMENPDMFSYDKYTSPNFLDIVLSYTLSDDVPLSFLWSMILFGQGGDYEINDDGTDTNSYSNYVEMSYRLFEDDNTKISASVGGAFSFTTEKTFYSSSAEIVNVSLNLTQEVTVFAKTIPVTGTAFWNPYSGVGALQIDIMLF